MKKWIPFAALIGTLALGALAFAPPRAGRSPKAQPYRMLMGRMLENPRLLQKLDLDSDKVAALRRLRYEASKQRIRLQSEVRLARLDLRHSLSAEQPNESAVMAAVERAGQAATELHKSDVRHLLKARAILGPEKWQKLKQIMAEHARHRQMRRPDHHRDARGQGRRPGPPQPGAAPRPMIGDEP